jgi:phosphoadenylyl-sulfate reductase (thioredoxin)
MPETLPVDPAQLESATAEEILAVAMREYGSRFGIATAFQAEGMVLVDMAVRIDPGVRVFTLDTGRLPEETHQMITAVRSRYGISVEIVTPDTRELEAMTTLSGVNLFRDSVAKRKLCCQIRKVHPMKRKVTEFDCVASGLRRSQSEERAHTPKVFRDGDLWTLAPLAEWTSDEVRAYIAEHDVPHHPLYEKGYASIGCGPCTRAIQPGEAERAGRWWWELDADKECGLHRTPDGRLRRELDILLDQVRAAAR